VIGMVSAVRFAHDGYHLPRLVTELTTRDRHPVAIIKKAQSIAWLLGWAMVDQRGRDKKLAVGEKIRVEECRAADRLWHLIPAACLDRQATGFSPEMTWELIVESGGLLTLASGIPIDELARMFQSTALHVQHVNRITDYLLRMQMNGSSVRPTIEDAKEFVRGWYQDFAIRTVSQAWEDFKLAAPYLFGFCLDQRLLDVDLTRIESVIEYAVEFAQDEERITSFVGHAASTMDRLTGIARCQRMTDFEGVIRKAPPLTPFSDEELKYIESIDRMAPIP
jgi:hypothetical protein